MALLKLAFPKQHIIITSRESQEIMDKAYKICTITDIEPKPYTGAYSGENEEYQQAEVKNKMTFSEFVQHFNALGYRLIDCFDNCESWVNTESRISYCRTHKTVAEKHKSLINSELI